MPKLKVLKVTTEELEALLASVQAYLYILESNRGKTGHLTPLVVKIKKKLDKS